MKKFIAKFILMLTASAIVGLVLSIPSFRIAMLIALGVYGAAAAVCWSINELL